MGTDTQIGTMMFFQSFALAIMLEDGVQALWRRFSGEKKRDDSDENVLLWQKLVGYVWVMIFYSLVAPWMMYPVIRIPPEKKWMVPISVVDALGIRATGMILGGLAVVIVAFLKPEF
jgi:hypothetical protein